MIGTVERMGRLRHRGYFTLSHVQSGGWIYFLTFRCMRGMRLDGAERAVVLESVKWGDGRRYELHGVVVMPDHVHFLETPKQVNFCRSEKECEFRKLAIDESAEKYAKQNTEKSAEQRVNQSAKQCADKCAGQRPAPLVVQASGLHTNELHTNELQTSIEQKSSSLQKSSKQKKKAKYFCMKDDESDKCRHVEERWVANSEIVRTIKAFTAVRINKMKGRSGALWDGDFYERAVRDVEDYWVKMEYMVCNPEKRNMVSDGFEYEGLYMSEESVRMLKDLMNR